jgi:8-oxo-dGTP diphosphatase
MQAYVIGFAFTHDLDRVALIRKTHPEWQKGKLNGIGGRIEPGDCYALTAMRREFQEEAGVDVDFGLWEHFATVTGNDYMLECFATRETDITALVSRTEERIELVYVADLWYMSLEMVTHLLWLLEMAVERLTYKLDTHFRVIVGSEVD